MKNQLPQMNHKAIIFDFFGVISSEVAPIWAKQHGLEKRFAEISKTIIVPGDKGNASFAEVMQKLADLTKTTAADTTAEWFNLIRINKEMLQLVLSLKDHFAIGLCSDAAFEFLRKVLEIHDLDQYFDNVVISSEVKATKNDGSIFQHVLSRFHCLASEVIFIDDNPNNIAIAQKIGITGIAFTDLVTLKKELLQFVSFAL